MTSMSERDRHWPFVTNHTRALAYIGTDPHARLRDIADAVGITERTAGHIVNDLEHGGCLTKTRDGRRNQYAIDGRTTGA
jgi:DNA-binding MarR family transcriptional regulator